ncbi:LytR/AlgR family response regulator transcription factor [Hathewaya massiliensis]|uniref:LytR/AlgR family response regulator transcription factor n=1 Tax=Hathewaya massiliensis TaxID=1964382 RepID=UPI00115969FA|nr:LytTR family DNA-binding domain-containing protein [Hathewaya massiliensis]
MLKVVICEDNKSQREKITQIVENTILREEFNMELAVSSQDPNEVLAYMENNKSMVGIYFLDVDLHASMNGIKLAEKIRELDPNGFIIFVTTHSEMSFLTFEYKVEAMDYIIKDNYQNIKERVNKCIAKANNLYYSKNNKEDKFFTVNCDDTVLNIRFCDILFFETAEQVHKVRIHQENRQVEFYGTLKDIEEGLDDRFYRCHRSFIVNKDKINSIDKKERIIYMVNGEQCFASTRYIRGLVK